MDELLRSDTARLMLANSEFLILLNQSATDREELAGLLNISETQLGYITNVAAGCGLIRCAGNIVPFENSFPQNTKLYQLMTTKPDEALEGDVIIDETILQQGGMRSALNLKNSPLHEQCKGECPIFECVFADLRQKEAAAPDLPAKCWLLCIR